jgi:hypothetical protein
MSRNVLVMKIGRERQIGGVIAKGGCAAEHTRQRLEIRFADLRKAP